MFYFWSYSGTPTRPFQILDTIFISFCYKIQIKKFCLNFFLCLLPLEFISGWDLMSFITRNITWKFHNIVTFVTNILLPDVDIFFSPKILRSINLKTRSWVRYPEGSKNLLPTNYISCFIWPCVFLLLKSRIPWTRWK